MRSGFWRQRKLRTSCLARWILLFTTIRLSAKATWIEIQREPPPRVIAGKVWPPGDQPVVALWNHRGVVDIFGRYVEAQIVYDTELSGVIVNATLHAVGVHEPRNMLGQNLMTTRCGKAKYTDLQIQRVGLYTLLFSATYLSNNQTTNSTRAFEVVHGDPHRLALLQEPAGFWIKRPFQVQPIIEIRDEGNNRVNSSSLAVTVQLIPPGANSLWNDDWEWNAIRGIVNFGELPCRRCVGVENSGLAVGAQGYRIQLKFVTVPGVAPVTSGAFDVGTWPPYSMSLANYPLMPMAGHAFDRQPLIKILDIDGVVATWDPGEKLYIAVQINPRSAYIPKNLQGTTSIELVRGVAQFTDLKHDFMATMYNLKFSLVASSVSTVQSIISPLFDIVHGQAFQLSLSSSYGYPPANGTQPAGPVVGSTLATQPVVLVLDKVHNMLWSTIINVTVELYTADQKPVVDHGLLYNSTTSVLSCPFFKGKRDCSKCVATVRTPATCGTAQFTDLRVDRSFEDLVLRFSSPGLQSVHSVPFRVPQGQMHAVFIEQEPLGFKYNSPPRIQAIVSIKDRGNNTVPFDTNISEADSIYLTAQLCRTANSSNPRECFDTSTNQGEIASKTRVEKGVARFSDMVIRLASTNLTIEFCSSPPGLVCAESSEFQVTEDPIQLLVTRQPLRGVPGLNFPEAPVVQVGDMYSSTTTWAPNYGLHVNCTLCVAVGAVVNSSEGFFSMEQEWRCAPDDHWLELNSLSTCDYNPPDQLQKLLLGTTSRQVVEGLASFSDLRIDKRGMYKLRFTAGGLISTDSRAFLVTLGEPVRLSIFAEPAEIHPGLPFGAQPIVAVVDRGGNAAEYEHGTRINATLWSSGQNLGLVPTHFVAPTHSLGYHNATQLTRFGVAVFEGLRIDKIGKYFIRFNAELYTSIDSASIDVNVGIGVRLSIAVRPTGCCARAACNFRTSEDPTCITIPVISILDLGGNHVPWNNVEINATVLTRPSLNHKLAVKSFVAMSTRNGQARFTDFGLDKPGNYTVKFRNISPYVWRTRHPDGSWTSKDYWDFLPAEADFSVSGSFARLFLETNPSEIIPGAPMEQQPILTLFDAGGYVVDHDLTTIVTASVVQNDGSLILLGGQRSVSSTTAAVEKDVDHGGGIFFTDLRIDLTCKCVRMYFSASSGSSGSIEAKSLRFNVDVGPYHKLKVTRQPSDAVIGRPFGIQPHVALTDYGGNIVVGDSITYVTASVFRGTIRDLKSDSGKQILRMINGQAKFEDLKTNIADRCIQLEMLAVGRQPGYSTPFTIVPSLPFRVAFVDDGARDRTPIQFGPAGPRPGLPLKDQPLLKVEDVYGNRIGTGGEIVGGVRASLFEGGTPAQCSYPIKHCLIGTSYVAFNEFDGIARFTDLRIDRANTFGSYSILFESNDIEIDQSNRAGNHSKLFHRLIPIESNRDMIVVPGVMTVALEVVVEPDKFIPGVPMKVTPVLGVVDPGGNVVKSSLPTTISCTIRAENFWWLDLIGDKVILAFNGLETFNGLGVNTTARKVTLRFDNLFLGFVDSVSFDVSGPLTRLSLLSQTVLATAGENFPIDAVVRGFDSEDLIVTTFGHPPFPINTPDVITVAINGSTSYCTIISINSTTISEGEITLNTTINRTMDNRINVTINSTTICYTDDRLQGTNTSIYSYGLANFTDLRLDAAGTYYLRFTVPVLNISIVSHPIVIVNAKASAIRLIRQVQGPQEATYAVQQAPDVLVVDRFGNPVLDKHFMVLATFFQGLSKVPAQYVAGQTEVNTSQAIASFNDSSLRLSLAGDDFSIRLMAQGLPSIFTATFNVPVGAPYRMRILSAPTRFFEKEPFADDPSLELLDRGGNVVKSSDNITISLWSMQGCKNCSNSTNITTVNKTITQVQTRSTCTNQQSMFVREYDSNRLPCGQRVSGLYIVQPFCFAEYLNDTIVSFCAEMLQGDDYAGMISRHNKEGNFPTTWRFQTIIEMHVSAYLYNSSYNITFVNNTAGSFFNSTSNTTVNTSSTNHRIVSEQYNATTLFQLDLRYGIELRSNGTIVLGSCTSSLAGLNPRVYNLTDWEPVQKSKLRELLAISNMTVANLTVRCTPTIHAHNCTKYNFTRNLIDGRGSFSHVTLMSPSSRSESLKLRVTFRDREYKPFFAVSTHYVAPGYRLYSQDIVPVSAPVTTATSAFWTTPVPPVNSIRCNNINATNIINCTQENFTNFSTSFTTNNINGTNLTSILNESSLSGDLSTADLVDAVDYSKYHIIFETQNFQVSGPPFELRPLAMPPRISTGGSPFKVQPIFEIVDSGGRLVTKAFDIIVKATLVAGGGQHCNVARPYQCPPPVQVCAKEESLCPKLRGQALVTPIQGIATFTDLSITICNDVKVPYDLCVFGDFHVHFTAESRKQSLVTGAGFMTDPVNVSLQGVMSDSIQNFIGPPAVLFLGAEPIGGSRAGDLLPGMPTIVTQDAGGNRIIQTPVRLTALLSIFNETVPLEDYSQDGIRGTRSVSATYDGTFKWTDLSIDRSSDKFIMSFVQFEEVPGFPRAPTITSASTFVIEAGYGVKLTINVQPKKGVGGEPLLDQPRVVVLDKRDNLVRFESYNVSVRLTDEALLIGGVLSKVTMVDGFPIRDESATRFSAKTVGGVVQFVGLTIDKAAVCYRLVFSAAGLSDAVSEAFDILSGKVRQLLIIRQPSGAVPGQVLKTQPLIHLGDWGRNPVRYLRDRVEVTLVPGNLTANNTQTLKLYGNNLLQAKDGILEFTDLMIFHAGNGFTLLVSRYVGGMDPIVSAPIDLLPGVPHRLKINVQPAGAASGAFLRVQPEVQVEDAGGNRVEAGSHVITATLYQLGLHSAALLRGPECTAYECAGQLSSNNTDAIRAFCPTCVMTNTSAGRDLVTTIASVEGISKYTALAIGTVGNGYVIRFVSTLLLGAESNPPLSVSVGMPVRLVFERMPQGFLFDIPFRVQPIVKVVDSGGNIISDRQGLVAVTLNHRKSSQILPIENTRVTMIRGRATFIKLKVDRPGIGFTMTFTGNMCSNLSMMTGVPCLSATSLPFNVTARRTHVENNVQVETSMAYKLLSPQPQLHLLDAENRTVSWDSGRLVIAVAIDPATNPNNATLSGNLRVPCCSGVCTFTDLSIDKALVGYRLIFSGPPLVRLVSPPFDVVGPRYLRMSVEPIAYVSGDPLIQQPHIEVLDVYRRPISGYWLTVSVAIRAQTGPAGGLLNGSTSLLTNESMAVFTDLTLDGYGSSYVLEFSCLWFDRILSKPFDVELPARPNVCVTASFNPHQCTESQLT